MHSRPGRTGHAVFSLFLLCAVPAVNPAAAGETVQQAAGPAAGGYAELPVDSPRRQQYMPSGKVVRALRLKPGMRVLDLGAGKGYFTFPIADALRGTGMVFAAEVSPDIVRFLQDQVQKRKYRNVTPVLVTPEASDPFYRKERFDVIFVSEVCWQIPDWTAFFRQLRPRLKPGGRLYVIDADVRAVFVRGNIDDANGLFRDLRQAGEDHPVFRRLNETLRDYVRRGDLDAAVPEATVEDLVGDLNRMLDDRTLPSDLDAYLYARIPHSGNTGPSLPVFDNYVLHWFEYQAGETGIAGKPDAELTPFERQALRVYNRFILQAVFSGRVNCLYTMAPVHMPIPRTLVRQIEEAGYTFIGPRDVLAAYYFLEFSGDGGRN